MTTPARRKLENDIRRDLQAQGASVRLLDSWPAKATYYKPSGEAMPNLPADPWSMKRYLARGFTLEPPKQAITAPSSSAAGAPAEKLVCPICGRDDFKAKIGLIGHKRSHEKKGGQA